MFYKQLDMSVEDAYDYASEVMTCNMIEKAMISLSWPSLFLFNTYTTGTASRLLLSSDSDHLNQ